MELRHLRYFVAVAEALNFRKAADRLHVSAPTLSQQVKDLEHSVGATLLERDTARVRLTKSGEIFLPEAKRLLSAAEGAAKAARDAERGLRGTLSIGNAAALSHSFMPDCVRRFGKNYPNAEVLLVEIDLMKQAAAVEAGEIDLGFTLVRDPAFLARFSHHLVIREPLRALLALDCRGTGQMPPLGDGVELIQMPPL